MFGRCCEGEFVRLSLLRSLMNANLFFGGRSTFTLPPLFYFMIIEQQLLTRKLHPEIRLPL